MTDMETIVAPEAAQKPKRLRLTQQQRKYQQKVMADYELEFGASPYLVEHLARALVGARHAYNYRSWRFGRLVIGWVK
jgi:hypothetical protein